MSLSNLLQPARLQDVGFSLNFDGVPTELTNDEILGLWKKIVVPGERTAGKFHPSEVANPYVTNCDRRLYYGIAGAEVNVTHIDIGFSDNRMLRLFDLGTLLHLYIQTVLYSLGYLESFETKVKDAKRKISGHADGVFKPGVLGLPEGKKAVLEIKSINDNGFRRLYEPKKEHIQQASIYAEVLGIDKLYFLYYNKNTSDIKDYVTDIDSRFVGRFFAKAEKMVKTLSINKFKRGKDVIKHDLPERICKHSSDRNAIGCKYSDICFK